MTCAGQRSVAYELDQLKKRVVAVENGHWNTVVQFAQERGILIQNNEPPSSKLV